MPVYRARKDDTRHGRDCGRLSGGTVGPAISAWSRLCSPSYLARCQIESVKAAAFFWIQYETETAWRLGIGNAAHPYIRDRYIDPLSIRSRTPLAASQRTSRSHPGLP